MSADLGWLILAFLAGVAVGLVTEHVLTRLLGRAMRERNP